eukprot:m.20797 g.20797  ORF g.20797 m.20797 type:complete len:192 (+) comp8625_c0_seq1:169-744(+)
MFGNFRERRVLLLQQSTTRANSVLADTIKYAQNSSVDPKERKKCFANITYTLNTIEFDMMRTFDEIEMSEMEIGEYEKKVEQLSKRIEVERTEVEKLYTQLQHEQTLKANKQEYDLLVKKVECYPTRGDTLKAIAKVNEELKKLTTEKSALEEKISLRRKQISLLLHSAKEFAAMLKEDDMDEDEDVTDNN